MAAKLNTLLANLATTHSEGTFRSLLGAGLVELDGIVSGSNPPLDKPWMTFYSTMRKDLAALLQSGETPASQQQQITALAAPVSSALATIAVTADTGDVDLDQRLTKDANSSVKARLELIRQGLGGLANSSAIETMVQDALDAIDSAQALMDFDQAELGTLRLIPAASLKPEQSRRLAALEKAAPWAAILVPLQKSLSIFFSTPRTTALPGLSLSTRLNALGISGDADVMAAFTPLSDPTLGTSVPSDLARKVQTAIETLRIQGYLKQQSTGQVPPDLDVMLKDLGGVLRDLRPSAMRSALDGLTATYAKPTRFLSASPLEDADKEFIEQVDLVLTESLSASVPPGISPEALAVRLRSALARLDELNDPSKTIRRELSDWAGVIHAALVAVVSNLGAAPVREKLREIVARYRDVTGPGLPEDTEIAIRVFDNLKLLDDKLGTLGDGRSQLTLLRQTIRRLRTELVLAQSGGYPRVEPWLNGLVSELDDAAQAIGASNLNTALAATVAAPPPPDQTSTAGNDPTQTLKQSLIATLIKSAVSPPPRNSTRLKRDPEDLLTGGSADSLASSDIVPQLLINLDARLKPVLYPALSNAEVNPSSAPGTAYALRVKAAPFGAAAPLRPVYGEGDQANVVVGHEEWPLFEQTTTLKLESIPAETTTTDKLAQIKVDLRVARNGVESAPASPIVLKDSSVPMGAGRVSVRITPDTPGAPSPKVVTLQIFDPAQSPVAQTKTITLTFGRSNEKKINVQIGEITLQIETGETLTASTATQVVTVDFEGGPANLTISETASLPPPIELRPILALDGIHDQIIPGSWVVIDRGTTPGSDTAAARAPKVAQVLSVETVSIAAFNISAKVTRLHLDRDWMDDSDVMLSDLRATAVYAQSEPLRLAESPFDADLRPGQAIELGQLYDGLKSGRWVIVSGERTDIAATQGVRVSELAIIRAVRQQVNDDIPGDKLHSFLVLGNDLSYSYKRSSVTIYGNVARATHGETRSEVLGSGSGSSTFQEFTLRQPPLTFVSSPTPRGIASTLEIKVDDVVWSEAPNLAALGPNDRKYVTRNDDTSKTIVTFGDGLHGARLPTGTENVKAAYRSGIGTPGNVDAQKISLLATRPLGVKSVINPLPATGGADREERDQARENAPLGITALDRLVSVQDFEDFARTFAGIGKARAVRLPGSRGSFVHVTIAGAGDIPIDVNSDLFRNLQLALHSAGDPFQPVRIDLRELVTLVIAVDIHILPDATWEVVVKAIRDALLDEFSFERRDFGQDAYLADVYRVIQAVSGVDYSQVQVFGGIPEHTGGTTAQPQDVFKRLKEIVDQSPPAVVRVKTTRVGRNGTVMPAQIAVLLPSVPDTLILNEIA